jgi:hypothetical protein
MSESDVLALLFSGICRMWSRSLASSRTFGLSIGHFSSDYYLLNMHASLTNKAGDEVLVVSAALTSELTGLELRGDVSFGDGRVVVDLVPVHLGSSIEGVGAAALEQFVESLSLGLVESVRNPEVVSALAL